MSEKKKQGKAFGVLQQVGRSFFLPVSMLPIAGILLGVGASFTNPTTIASLGLESVLTQGSILYNILDVMNKVGGVIFGNLPLIFAIAVALGMANQEKATAALAAAVGFLVMHTTINALLHMSGMIMPDGATAETVKSGMISTVLGIQTLEMGVFGGILTGFVTSILHNKFYKQELPAALSFFAGTRFVPIITTVVMAIVGLISFFVWPTIQNVMFSAGNLVTGSGYAGTFIFGFMERILIPFGLHHVFYIPFWQTALGGTAIIDGVQVAGAQNILFAEIASQNTVKYSMSAAKFMAGKYPFMMAGLPAAALAMYHTARPEKRDQAKGLLLSAALTSFLTGITEPIEFSFLFVAPQLFVLHCVFAGLAFVAMEIFAVAVGTTFSCGIIDFTIYGIIQGQAKTNWLGIIPILVVYAVLYYFVFKFAILKWNLQTPGREAGTDEVKLHTKAEYNERKNAEKSASKSDKEAAALEKSKNILEGVGGKENLISIDACATRLRLKLEDIEIIDEALLKATGAQGIIKKGNGIQIIYGPQVSVIKSNFEEYVETIM